MRKRYNTSWTEAFRRDIRGPCSSRDWYVRSSNEGHTVSCAGITVGTVRCKHLSTVVDGYLFIFSSFKPFDESYIWKNTTENEIIYNPQISQRNSFSGGVEQQAASVETNINPECYEYNNACFSIYGFEYTPGFDNAYITWIADNTTAWTMKAAGVGTNSVVQIGPRPISQEPMVRRILC